MDINDFSTPINRTAALVTSQPTTNDTNKLLEQRDNLRSALIHWNFKAQKGDAKATDKIDELKEQLRICNHKIKVINSAMSENMEFYITKVCRARFEKEEWQIIIHQARQQWNKELNGEL